MHINVEKFLEGLTFPRTGRGNTGLPYVRDSILFFKVREYFRLAGETVYLENVRKKSRLIQGSYGDWKTWKMKTVMEKSWENHGT